MKSKLKFILPLVLLIAGGAYKTVLAKPAAVPKAKIDGEVYVLPKDFYLNLAGGRYAKLGVALVLKAEPAAKKSGEAATVTPPEGYGTQPQEAVVRSIVTDVITGTTSKRLIAPAGREKLAKRILKRIQKTTDVKAEHVLLTDVAVQ